LIPGSGVGEAYANAPDPTMIVDAIAIYLTAWTIVTFLFLFVPSFYNVAAGLTIFSRLSVALPCFASRWV